MRNLAAAACFVLLAGAAQAQPPTRSMDIDEHGRPSRLPVQANWWAAHALVTTKPVADKPATTAKPKASKKRNDKSSPAQKRDGAGGVTSGG